MIAIVVCAFGLILQQLGIFSNLDHQLFDTIQQFTSYPQQDANVLLVYAEPATVEDENDQLLSLLHQINQFEPRKIAIIGGQNQLPLHQLAELPFANKMVIGCRLENWRSGGQQLGLAQGTVELKLAHQSVYRDHYLATTKQGKNYPTLECVIAASMTQPHLSPRQNRFGIRYCGSTNSLPNVTASQIIDNSIVPGLIRDKVVMIGTADPHGYGYATPTTRAAQRIGQLEIHGHVLETLLRGNYISDCHWTMQFALLALLSSIVAFMILRAQINRIPIRLFAAMATVMLVSVCSYHFLSLRIPPTALLCSICVAAGMAMFLRFRVLETYIRQLKLTANKAGYDQQDSWELIRLAALQQFYPHRMVCMELPPGRPHFQVVDTCNCDESHIAERRRDIQRFPYRQVCEMERPCTFPDYQFFNDGTADSTEYLIPLVHDSVVLGIVVASLTADQLEDWSNVDDCLTRFGHEMSRLLYERMSSPNNEKNKTDAGNNEGSQNWFDQLNVLPEESAMAAILEQERQVNKQLQRWEYTFRSSESALAICDPFGQVEFANEKLHHLLQHQQVIATDASTLELVSRISGRDITSCRRMIRDAVNQRKTSQIFLPAIETKTKPLTINIKPIITSALGQNSTHYPYVVVEVVDGAVFHDALNWQQNLTSSLCDTAEHSIQQIAQELDQFESGDTQTKSLQSLLGKLGQTLAKAGSTFNSCQQIAQVGVSDRAESCLPIDTLNVFESVRDEFGPKFEEQDTQLKFDCEATEAIAVANPFLLKVVFESIFDILLKRSFAGSELNIVLDKIDTQSRYEFRGAGGIENLSRDNFLRGNEQAEDEFNLEQKPGLDQELGDQISRIQGWLETWNGSLSFQNNDDENLVIELLLDNPSIGPDTAINLATESPTSTTKS